MGKIVMPKNSALLEEIEPVFKIYYDEGDWLSNDIYKERLKAIIGDDQYSSSYTKKAQIPAYFGFLEWEEKGNTHSRRRLTPNGIRMYKAILAHNQGQINRILVDSLEKVKFGRDNFGCKETDSDIEPPSLFIRASLDLSYLTTKEFAYLLWKLEDVGGNYTDSIAELKAMRTSGEIELGDEAQKYIDCKPIMALERWGFLTTDEENTLGGKHYMVAPSVMAKYEKRLKNLKIYNIDMEVDSLTTRPYVAVNYETTINIDKPRNRIIFGAPGTGKSFELNKEGKQLLGPGREEDFERVTFHPDYSYANFVGTYKPVSTNEGISYEFVPGPFLRVYVAALENSRTADVKPYLLLIEEINRAKVAAVFGDIFQLLDRDAKGASRYPIQTSEDMRKYLAKELGGEPSNYCSIRIPNNMFIWATMNSADQGVFPMDTAFKRRWDFTYLSIDANENGIAGKHVVLGKNDYARDVEWNVLRKAINNRLGTLGINEDKLLGPYYIQIDSFFSGGQIDCRKFSALFQNKVLMYLFEDAAKQRREELFSNATDVSRFSEVCKAFEEKGVFVFCPEISDLFTRRPDPNPEVEDEHDTPEE